MIRAEKAKLKFVRKMYRWGWPQPQHPLQHHCELVPFPKCPLPRIKQFYLAPSTPRNRQFKCATPSPRLRRLAEQCCGGAMQIRSMVAFSAPSPHEKTSRRGKHAPQHAKIDKYPLCDHGKAYQNTRDGELAACNVLRRWGVVIFWLCRQSSWGVSSSPPLPRQLGSRCNYVLAGNLHGLFCRYGMPCCCRRRNPPSLDNPEWTSPPKERKKQT